MTSTWRSKEKYLGIVYAQANDVIKDNTDLLEEIGRRFASGQDNDYERITKIISFLEQQRKDLPDLTIIYSGQFEGKPALYEIHNYYGMNYMQAYFKCTPNLDCDYLKKFFAGENVDVLQQYTLQDDQFFIYIPYMGKEGRFVLLFDRRNSYGKIGS